MTEVLERMNEGGNSSISSMVGSSPGGVGKRGGGRGSSHSNVQSKEGRSVYSDTPYVKERHLNGTVRL